MVQRVRSASVEVGGKTVASIGPGLHVYLGVDRTDTADDVAFLADKLSGLRVFPDEEGRLNRDVRDVGGNVLVVSAFTVSADARKGRRPSFDLAAPAEAARRWYDAFCDALAGAGLSVQRGVFGADMCVRTDNDGPVCILLDSRKAF
ncbi:MAG: D-tyrosyl-tRNA(Tyr) deacylase [Phycisphaerales bacterium]|nr:D-tyrosyl-tRNA(Tyr) deacylase [Phycisphaerales bacterium]